MFRFKMFYHFSVAGSCKGTFLAMKHSAIEVRKIWLQIWVNTKFIVLLFMDDPFFHRSFSGLDQILWYNVGFFTFSNDLFHINILFGYTVDIFQVSFNQDFSFVRDATDVARKTSLLWMKAFQMTLKTILGWEFFWANSAFEVFDLQMNVFYVIS